MTTIFPPRGVGAIQPTNRLHIGNYFGAVCSSIELETFCSQENFCFIADYHAQTAMGNKEQIGNWTIKLTGELLCLGLDPNLTSIYRQSDIPEVTEIMWLLSISFVSSKLTRGHKMQSGEIATAAIYLYPLLMAADILGIKATTVPIGDDQNQHLERVRDAAKAFNMLVDYELFPIPRKMAGIDALVPGIDATRFEKPRKMSKSLGNIIPIFCSDDDTAEYVKKISTRPIKPGEPISPAGDTVFRLYQLVSRPENVQAMKEGYESGKLGYDEAKGLLTAAICNYFAAAREQVKQFSERRQYILAVLNDGEGRVRQEMRETLGEMRERTGVGTFSRYGQA